MSERVGQRANPHPSQTEHWIVEAIAEEDDMVRVRYVDNNVRSWRSWWITAYAWDQWVRLTKEGAA